MKKILCDKKKKKKLKAIDSYCFNSDIGLIVQNGYILEQSVISRIVANKWNRRNNYFLIFLGEISQTGLQSLINAAEKCLISKVLIPFNWTEENKKIIENYCLTNNIIMEIEHEV